MNKRKFLETAGKTSLGLFAMPYLFENASLNPLAKKKTKNWIWARPKDQSIEVWKKDLEKVKKTGFDAVLLEVYNGNVTHFENSKFPVKEALLEKLIPICKEIGLEMHGWMWTMPCTNEKIVKEHPDWYAVNGLGESAATKPAYVDYYKFLCPCHPEAQEFIRENVENLAKVEGLDGVHLDYVRLPDVILAEALQPKYNIVQDREFPQYDYSYSEHCRKGFKEKTGIDPLTDLKDPSANVEWRQFRQDSVSNLVNEKLAPEARKQNKMVTAAVFPNWPAVRQEWKTWNLDAFLPMLYHNFYNENLNWIGEKTKEEVNFVNNNQPVYSGLFVPSLSPKELKKAYQISIKSGGSGMALFDLYSLKDEHWEVLAKLLS